MNVYDFDNTILDGDSEELFFKYINDNNLLSAENLRELNSLTINFVTDQNVYFNNCDKVYSLIAKNIHNLNKIIENFWKQNSCLIKSFYKKIQKDSDVISSASPSFLLTPMMRIIGNKHLIAAEFDFKKLSFNGNYNFGKYKVKNFKKIFPSEYIDIFYSDSDSDLPMAKIAKKAIKVNGNNLKDWIF